MYYMYASMNGCIYACMNVIQYVHMNGCMNMYIYIYRCMYVGCTYEWMHEYVYIYIDVCM